MGNLTNLIELKLDNNDLNGIIPPSIGNLDKLNNLMLNLNDLAGNIPSELGNLINLTQLVLYGNKLEGSIPVEYSNLNNLTNLSLDNNLLDGTIPPELGYLNNLTVLRLGGNQLTGCYHPLLSQLCTNGFTNANISDGNSLDAEWEDFCSIQEGMCVVDCSDPTYYWTGDVSIRWTNPLNWNTGCVPDASKNVSIASGNNFVSIKAGESTLARSIAIGTSDTLRLRSNSNLLVGPNINSTYLGIDNYGTLLNNGDISFRNISATNIQNKGNLINGKSSGLNTGEIIIDNTFTQGPTAIINQDTFINFNNIEVKRGVVGIKNEGKFFNHFDIDITDTESHGIWNKEGEFENETIAVGVIASINIHDLSGSTANGIHNEAIFNDYSNMTISNLNGHGIHNTDVDVNDTQYALFKAWNGLQITNVGGNGVKVDTLTAFDFNGDITIINAGQEGLYSQGNTQIFGTKLTIAYPGGDGIYSSHTLSQQAEVFINTPAGHGILNDGEYAIIFPLEIAYAGKNGISNNDYLNISSDVIINNSTEIGLENNGVIDIHSNTTTVDESGLQGVVNNNVINIMVTALLEILNSTDVPFESILGSELTCDGELDVQN